MRAYIGTSGYSYKEWKGSFYPDKMKPAEMKMKARNLK